MYSLRPLPTARRPLLIIVTIIVLMLVGLGVFYAIHTHYMSQTTSPAVNTPSPTNSQPAPTNPGTSQPAGQNQATSQNGNQTPQTPPTTPSGDFVSNHHPSLSNNPVGSGYLTSTCTTTPGATCQIVFTKDGAAKSLPAETADARGTVYWQNWRPQDYGLTQGSWTITAVAKLGTQTASAQDVLQLEVQP